MPPLKIAFADCFASLARHKLKNVNEMILMFPQDQSDQNKFAFKHFQD